MTSTSPIVYVLGNTFGSIDVSTGVFTQIGPTPLEGAQGLAPGPSGSLLTLAFSGNLDFYGTVRPPPAFRAPQWAR